MEDTTDVMKNVLKVIRLKDEVRDLYLAASSDKITVTECMPDRDGCNPKLTEWRVEWLMCEHRCHLRDQYGRCRNIIVGQVRLWSIFDKLLTFKAEINSCRQVEQALTQSTPDDDRSQSPAAKWKIEANKKGSYMVDIKLCGWSDNTSSAKWGKYHTNWVVEVVEPAKEEERKTSYYPKIGKKERTLWKTCEGRRRVVLRYGEAPTGELMIFIQYPCKPRSSPPDFESDDDRSGRRNALKIKQAGQVNISNVLPPAPGAGAATNYLSYYNSGGNFNGSGVQTNGDVMAPNLFDLQIL